MYQILHSCCRAVLALVVLTSLTMQLKAQSLEISEFMAVNSKTLADEDGDYSDWIEIHNAGSESVDLLGWYLTDNATNRDKWAFPSTVIAADGYLVVFASDKSRCVSGAELHTNFKLSGSGEYVALVKPDGKTIVSTSDIYPAQSRDVSYGLYNGVLTYLEPTPRAANVLGSIAIVPSFSKERGFYSSPFEVSLSSPEAGVTIYYTVDGSRPTLTNSIKYTSPITISTTTVLSAVAVNSAGNSSFVVCNTYIFTADVAKQSNEPEGYPTKWGPKAAYPSDYEMDPDVCLNNEARLDVALKSLPTISLVTDIANLFKDDDDYVTGGIYMNPEKSDSLWERPVSAEYFDSETGKAFQINCGVRIHGGNSRKPGNSPKHSFRLSFRDSYGPSKLDFKFFDDADAANEFNTLVLRAGFNYSWITNKTVQCTGADFVRDPFAKKTQLDMGQLSAHTKFVHLYINGLYWGVYNVSEKINDDFLESYLGGKEEDYDVINDDIIINSSWKVTSGTKGITDGKTEAWVSVVKTVNSGFSTNAKYFAIQGKNSDGSDNAGGTKLLDMQNYIDYMILNYYMGNKDWDKNNWIVGRNRETNESGFRYFCWDVETSMDEVNADIVSTLNNANNPTGFLNKLKVNSEFVLNFADRVQKHFFNGGSLTPSEVQDRYMSIADVIEVPLFAESARWGDYRRDVHPDYTYDKTGNEFELYTVDEHWQKRIADVQSSYIPYRTDIVLQQFKDAGLYPSNIEAPVLSNYGGVLSASVDLTMSAAIGDVYYTLDGSDPRLVGGSLSTSASKYSQSINISKGTTVKARAKNGSTWSPVVEAVFIGNGLAAPSVSLGIEQGCYPNPVRDVANIWYSIPCDGDVDISIFSIDGRMVEKLFADRQQSGKYLIQWTPSNVRNGIYFCRIKFNGVTYNSKIVVRR